MIIRNREERYVYYGIISIDDELYAVGKDIMGIILNNEYRGKIEYNYTFSIKYNARCGREELVDEGNSNCYKEDIPIMVVHLDMDKLPEDDNELARLAESHYMPSIKSLSMKEFRSGWN